MFKTEYVLVPFIVTMYNVFMSNPSPVDMAYIETRKFMH